MAKSRKKELTTIEINNPNPKDFKKSKDLSIMSVNNSNLNAKFSIFGGIGLPITKYLRTLSSVSGRYIPYTGSGLAIKSDNYYPNAIVNLVANSPTLGQYVEKTSLFTVGKGIDFDAVPMPKELKNFLLKCNDKESINDILEKISPDLVANNGFALKVYWTYGKKIAAIEHCPFKNVRKGTPEEGTDKITYYVISNDWEQKMERSLRREYVINAFNPDALGDITVTGDEVIVEDEKTLENGIQLLYFEGNSVVSDWYTVPSYVQCLDAAFGEVQVGVCQNSQIRNGVNGSFVISHDPETVVDDDLKQSIVDNISNLASDAQNTGGIIYIPASVKVQQLEGLKFDQYEAINKENRQRIITGCGIPSILLEYSQSGGFNNRGEEMRQAFLTYQQTKIAKLQQTIVRVLNTIADHITTQPYNIQILPFSFDTPNDSTEVQDTSGNV